MTICKKPGCLSKCWFYKYQREFCIRHYKRKYKKDLGEMANKSYLTMHVLLDPPITEKESYQLLREIKHYEYESEEYKHLRQQICQVHLRLVIWIINRYYNEMAYKFNQAYDMFQEGLVGLMRAVDLYDETKSKFSTYAFMWIRAKVSRYSNGGTKVIYIPTNKMEKILKLERGGHIEQDEELKWISDHLFVITNEFLGDATYEDTSNKEFEDKQAVNRVMKFLDDREKKIIEHRFGLNGKKSKTLDEVGRLIGRTRERVRQIEKKAINKLKERSMCLR